MKQNKTRTSTRIARQGINGARLIGNDRPQVEKFANDQASTESATVGPLNESVYIQTSPQAATPSEPQTKQKPTRTKWSKEE